MKASTLRICAMAAALLPLATAAHSYAAAITKIVIYSSAENGAWDGVDLWDSIGSNANYNLGVYQNLTPLRGAFDGAAGVNIPISAGTSTFELAAAPGADRPNFDLQIYFDNASLPQISVIAPLTTSSVAVGGSFVGSPTLGGASFTTGGNTYTITSFVFNNPGVLGIDLIHPFTLGADGTPDYVGTFTITSAPAVSQAVPEPASLGLLGVGALALLRRSKKR